MDRIRKALDLARMERVEPSQADEPAPQAAAAIRSLATHRIRKALDLAKLARVELRQADAPALRMDAVPPRMDAVPPLVDAVLPRVDTVPPLVEVPAPPVDAAPPAAEGRPADAARSVAPTPIVYTRTQVFTPQPDVLERSRIISPASGEFAAAAFRMLRTQVLQRMEAHAWRSLAIFSPGSDDGKTTTALNLAVSLAAGPLHTVLLVEYDFKNPTIASRFGLNLEQGVDDVLMGNAALEDCLWHPQGYDRLVVLPARGKHENSSEILAGPRNRELVTEIRKRYPERIIVFDLPPVLNTDDALSFAPLVECGLVVAAEGQTRRTDLVRTIELLAKTPLLGTVLNRASDKSPGY